jgi:hypothetical protein
MANLIFILVEKCIGRGGQWPCGYKKIQPHAGDKARYNITLKWTQHVEHEECPTK